MLGLEGLEGLRLGVLGLRVFGLPGLGVSGLSLGSELGFGLESSQYDGGTPKMTCNRPQPCRGLEPLLPPKARQNGRGASRG